MTGEFSFETLAIVANVTTDILREVVWGDEDLTLDEAVALRRALTPYGDYTGFSFGYLISPVLAVVRPGTNKARYRAYTLRRLLETGEPRIPAHWCSVQRGIAWNALTRMERGEAVPYAAYRAGVASAKYIIARAQEIQRVATRRGMPLEQAAAV